MPKGRSGECSRVTIEEHQAGDLVFAYYYYLYILLEATLAWNFISIIHR